MYMFIYDSSNNLIMATPSVFFDLNNIKQLAPSVEGNKVEDVKFLTRLNKYVPIDIKIDRFFAFRIDSLEEAVAFMLSQDQIFTDKGSKAKIELKMILKDPDFPSLDLDGFSERLAESNRELTRSKFGQGSKSYKKGLNDFKNILSSFDRAMGMDMEAQFAAFEEQFRTNLTDYDKERTKRLKPMQDERNRLKQQFESFIVNKL